MAPTVTGLFQKHTPVARLVASEFYAPGMERDDMIQEALIALWIAARGWTPEGGASFPSFARIVIRRRLASVVLGALALKHGPLNDSVRDNPELGEDVLLVDGVDTERVVIARDRLRRIIGALDRLTPMEREALADRLNGEPVTKQRDNAWQRARGKLQEAA